MSTTKLPTTKLPTTKSATTRNDPVVDWLLAGDPAIRWQVLADLVGAPADVVARERSRVVHEGWGAELLARQDDGGTWANALYSPKWTSTTYTLLLLHWLGLPRGNEQALRGCALLWDRSSRYDGGLNLAKSIHEPETCITAMLVLLAASFGLDDERVDPTVAWLLGQQLADGGWNCETIRHGSRHGSFHTTISALDALFVYEHNGGRVPVADAAAAGREFFADHRLYRSHRTGDVVDPALLRYPFPPQWHHDVLRGLEHFRAAGASRDDRLADAVDVVRRGQRADGTWLKHRRYPGRVWFELEPAGPSRWATLRARRVLAWWDNGAG